MTFNVLLFHAKMEPLPHHKYKTLSDIYDLMKFDKTKLHKFLYFENYIVNLFNRSIIDEDPSVAIMATWNGHYYSYHKKYDLMKKYYTLAIELGSVSSIHAMGHYYHYIEKNYSLMEKYYVTALESHHCYQAAIALGRYHYSKTKDFHSSVTYFLLAIEYGKIEAYQLIVDRIKKENKNKLKQLQCFVFVGVVYKVYEHDNNEISTLVTNDMQIIENLLYRE